MYEITNRWSGKVLHTVEDASTLREAVLKVLEAARTSPTRTSGRLRLICALYIGLVDRPEVETLLAKLREGGVDGSLYEGPCSCLVGTLATARGCRHTEIPGLIPNASRPAERFFMGIRKGDTPETSRVSRLAAEWVEKWLAENPAAVTA